MPKLFRDGRFVQYDVPKNPLTLIMEDEIIHTVDFPVCAEPTCICHKAEYHRLEAERTAAEKARKRTRTRRPLLASSPTTGIAAQLSSTQGFRLLR